MGIIAVTIIISITVNDYKHCYDKFWIAVYQVRGIFSVPPFLYRPINYALYNTFVYVAIRFTDLRSRFLYFDRPKYLHAECQARFAWFKNTDYTWLRPSMWGRRKKDRARAIIDVFYIYVFHSFFTHSFIKLISISG